MKKYEKKVERNYNKLYIKANDVFQQYEYKKASKLFSKCYRHFKDINELSKAYDSLKKYIISLINTGVEEGIIRRLDELESYALKTNDQNYLAFVYGTKGLIHNKVGEYEETIDSYKKAKKIYIIDGVGNDKTQFLTDPYWVNEGFPVKNLSKILKKTAMVTGNIPKLMTYYHSSLDNLKQVKAKYLKQAYQVTLKAIS